MSFGATVLKVSYKRVLCQLDRTLVLNDHSLQAQKIHKVNPHIEKDGRSS